MRRISTSFWLTVVMITRSRIVLAVISLFVGLLVCSSEAQAFFVYMQANATGGGNLALNDNDVTDGWAGDYDAEATHTSPVSPYQDQGYAKASLTVAGVELKSRSYAPDVYANSRAQLHDNFTLDTMSGTEGAVLNFGLTGTIQILNAQDSDATLWADLMARQGGSSGPVLDYKLIRYDVAWDGLEYVGSNDTTWNYLFPVNPTITGPTTGPTYTFDVPLSLDLDAMEADHLIFVSLSISSNASGAIVDLSNTFQTDTSNPFEITSNPSGNSYMLETGYGDENVKLFGSTLDGEEVIPEPGTILLLGAGLVSIAGITRRKLKQ